MCLLERKNNEAQHHEPRLLFVPLSMMLLNGCVSQDYLDHKANADQVQKQMEDALKQRDTTWQRAILDQTARSGHANQTRQSAKVVPTRSAHQSQSTAVVACALDARARHQCGSVSFDPDVNPNTPITVNTRASRKSILNLISSLTHYGLTPDQDSLTVGYYQTETFVLTIPSGANSAQQGSQSEESSSDDEGDTSTTKVDGQYITTVYNNTEITTEIAKAVEAVLKDESEDDGDELVGDVRVVPGLTAITVRTTPSRMAQVRRLVDTYRRADQTGLS